MLYSLAPTQEADLVLKLSGPGWPKQEENHRAQDVKLLRRMGVNPPVDDPKLLCGTVQGTDLSLRSVTLPSVLQDQANFVWGGLFQQEFKQVPETAEGE